VNCNALTNRGKPCGRTAFYLVMGVWWCHLHTPGKHSQVGRGKKVPDGCVLPLSRGGMSLERFFEYCELTKGACGKGLYCGDGV